MGGCLCLTGQSILSLSLSLLSYASFVDVQLNRRATLQPLFYFKAARLHEHSTYTLTQTVTLRL